MCRGGVHAVRVCRSVCMCVGGCTPCVCVEWVCTLCVYAYVCVWGTLCRSVCTPCVCMFVGPCVCVRRWGCVLCVGVCAHCVCVLCVGGCARPACV